jgi:hypothetical protein
MAVGNRDKSQRRMSTRSFAKHGTSGTRSVLDEKDMKVMGLPIGIGMMIGIVVGAVIGGSFAIGIGLVIGMLVGAVVGVVLRASSKPQS